MSVPQIKPSTRPRPSTALLACAASIWALNSRGGQSAVDLLRVNDLPFSAGAAAPTWARRAGGNGLHFDGGDDAHGTLATPVSAFPFWMACSFTPAATGAARIAFSIASNAATSAHYAIYDSGSVVAGRVRTADGGTEIFVIGPSSYIGNTFHCALISRGQADHKLWVNGNLFASTSDTGAGLTNNFVTAALGCLWSSAFAFNPLIGSTHWATYGTIDPGDGFFYDLTRNPWRHLYSVEPHRFYSLPTSVATGSGVITDASSSVAGAGLSSSEAAGVITAQTAAVSGVGISSSTSTGTITVQSATLAGAGVGSSQGTGVLADQAGTVSGAGIGSSTGAGVLADQAGAVSGAGVGASTGTGALNGQDATAAGAGTAATTGITGTGALTSVAGISGAGVSSSLATGVISVSAATVRGTASIDSWYAVQNAEGTWISLNPASGIWSLVGPSAGTWVH